MSDGRKIRLDSKTASDTVSIAEKLGLALKGDEVIELTSDLGGGKTTFVRGLALGFGSLDKVSSPTFTISKVYTKDGQSIHHFDFYRLNDPGLMSAELDEAIHIPGDVVVVEWANIVYEVLPKSRLTVKFELAKEGRTLVFQAPKELDYLIKAVEA
jgi:tRNA threonylcarbamoyladenosine biosynthesis protein TsaE